MSDEVRGALLALFNMVELVDRRVKTIQYEVQSIDWQSHVALERIDRELQIARGVFADALAPGERAG